MIPYPYNMVDMGGIDLAEANGTIVEGLYAKIVEAVNACGDVVLYNWKFAGIEISPQHTSILLGDPIIISGAVQVTAQDEVTVPGINPEPQIITLNVSENGEYLARDFNADGFDPVNVSIPPPVAIPLEVRQNGVYVPQSGVVGYAPVTVDVEGSYDNVAMLKIGGTHAIISAVGTIYSITNGSGDFIVPVGEDKSEVKLDLSQPFEICCKFKIANSPGTTGRNIWGSINAYYHCPCIAVKSTQAEYYVTTNGSTWQYSGVAITPSGWTCPLNTWMVAKLIWDGSGFEFYFYDGTNEYTSVLQNVTPYYNSGYRFCFGSQYSNPSYCIAACDASIDLAETYLKQNNTKIWGLT